ncbi:MAG: EamA family transporter [Bacteroidota bacterium]
MRRAILLGFLLLLTFDTASQVFMKLAAEGITRMDDGAWLSKVAQEPLILLVLLCYLGAFLTYISLLRYAPVGPAYAAAHGHIVTVLLLSILFFGERLSLVQGVGVLAIVTGIAILAVTETQTDALADTPAGK